MAHTKVTKTYSQNTGVANTFSYSGSFDTFKATEVVVELDNVALTYTASTINESASPREYTVDYTNKTVHIGGANLSSGTVVIKPETDLGSPTPRAEFTPGASITSADLNNNQKQLLRRAMEYEEQVMFKTGGVMTGTLEMGEDQVIKFEGATADGYETTLTVTDPTADRTITLPNVTGTVVTTGDTATVTATMLAANSVDSSELVDGSVDLSHMSANSVDTAQYVDGSIEGVHIANDAIDSQHYAAASIDNEHLADDAVGADELASNAVVNASIASGAAIAHNKLANITGGQVLMGNSSNIPTATAISGDVTLANDGAVTIATGAVEHTMLAGDAVDGDNIADDSVDSEHYVDGSIDLAHMSVNSVSTDQYVDNSIQHVHLQNDIIDGDNIQDDVIDSEHYIAGSIDNEHLADDAVGADELAANAVVNASVASGAAIDHAKLAAVSSGNILVGNGSNQAASVAMSGDVAIAAGGATTIQANSVEIGMIGCEQTTISDSDSHIPTSGAVVDYVAAVVGPIGGLEVIADDESFPNTIPAAGVVISITDCAGLSVNSSGVSTNGDALDNSTITINGFPSELRGGVGGNADPYVFASGAGLMVVSTGSSHTYNYHQALIREADFVQLSDDINDFNSRYRIGTRTANNSNTNDDGDLFFDTGTNKMYVYDGAYDSGGSWKEVTSAGDYKYLTIKDHDQAVGGSGPTFNDSNEEFDLFDGSSDASIDTAAQLIVVLNGVIQKPNTGTFSGSEEGFYLNDTHGIKFCDPPPSGSALFVTQIGTATTLSVPADDSVSQAKIQDGAVDTDQLAADAVEGSKIADDAVGAEHIEDLDANVKWVDSAKAVFGTGNDMEIYHNGTDAIIDAEASGATRSLILKGGTTTDRLIELQSSDAEPHVRCAANSYVKLYYDNSAKLETTSAGVTISGTLTADLADNSIDSEHYVDASIDHAHLADDCVDGDNIADNSVGLAAMAHATDGVIITFDANGAPAYVGPGTDGQVLTSTGAGSPPAFEDASGGGVTSDGQSNTVAGTNAGDSFTGTDANHNSLFGKDAGTALTTGDYNSVVGSGALITCATGSGNTAMGWKALEMCESGGEYNTAIGYAAGEGLTTGDRNVAIGSSALDAACTGDENVAIGGSALTAATSASGNVAIGYQAMTACTTQGYTTAVGYRAMASMVSGSTGNVAIGYKAMEDVTIADDGVAVGYGALANLTEGVKNVAVGAETLASVTTGQKNTGVGYLSLYQEEASDNTAVGYMALYAHVSNGKNTAVGAECLNSTVSGTEATAIGYQAGNSYTANGGVFVGRQAGKTNATTQDTVLYIARNADSAGNNGCWIYGNDIGQCFNGDNSSSWNTTSDQRLKKDIVDNNVGLSVIDNVKVRNFKYKQYNKDAEGVITTPKTSDDAIDLTGFASGTTAGNVVIGQGKTGTQIGVIAQELEAVCPDCIKTDDFGAKTVNTDELFWHMLNAIKELSTKVKALEAG